MFALFCGVRIRFDICAGLQENPSEEDAAVVDKIMASHLVKKEVTACGISLQLMQFFRRNYKV